MNRQRLWPVLFMLALLTLACGLLSRTVTITLTEERLNELIPQVAAANAPEGVAVQIATVDMREGFIRIYGTFQIEGGPPVEGSCDVVVTAQNGKLHAEVTAAQIAGFDLSQLNFEQVNEEIETALTSATAENQLVSFESVTIHEDAMDIVIRLNVP